MVLKMGQMPSKRQKLDDKFDTDLRNLTSIEVLLRAKVWVLNSSNAEQKYFDAVEMKGRDRYDLIHFLLCLESWDHFTSIWKILVGYLSYFGSYTGKCELWKVVSDR